MKLKTALLATACAAILTLPAQAALQLTVSLTPTAYGADPNGFDGSTWTFQFNSSQTNYVDLLGFAAVVTDSAFLTVSGATNATYNGTFAITETTTTNFANFPNGAGDLLLGLDLSSSGADFSFGSSPITVEELDLIGTTLANPSPDDPIQLADWQGASVSDSVVNVGGDFFDFGSGTINAATVPEPATYSALAGVLCIGLAIWRRLTVSSNKLAD